MSTRNDNDADNFKIDFKYYKRRQPPPHLYDVVDIYKGSSDLHLEALQSKSRELSISEQSRNLQEAGLNSVDKWKPFKIHQTNQNGSRHFTGLILISNALTEKGQLLWSLRCLKEYAKNPPNKTNLDGSNNVNDTDNHDTPYNKQENHSPPEKKKVKNETIPPKDSLRAYKKPVDTRVIKENKLTGQESQSWWNKNFEEWCTSQYGHTRNNKCQHVSEHKTMDQLRWATIGYHHNWNTKQYSKDNISTFPTDLKELCEIIISYIGNLSENVIEEKYVSNFSPEAGIINFYPPHASLGGHTDHSEPNREAPLLSLSFGLPAIFLCGGPTKNTKPTAVLLRSGDILIMTREARDKYHGVPRILDTDFIKVQRELSERKRTLEQVEMPIQLENMIPDFLNDCVDVTKSNDPNEKEIFFTKSYLTRHRININIRQVF